MRNLLASLLIGAALTACMPLVAQACDNDHDIATIVRRAEQDGFHLAFLEGSQIDRAFDAYNDPANASTDADSDKSAITRKQVGAAIIAATLERGDNSVVIMFFDRTKRCAIGDALILVDPDIIHQVIGDRF